MQTTFYLLVPSSCICSFDEHKPGSGYMLMDISMNLTLSRAEWKWSSVMKLVGSAVFLFTREENPMFSPPILMVRKSKSSWTPTSLAARSLLFLRGYKPNISKLNLFSISPSIFTFGQFNPPFWLFQQRVLWLDCIWGNINNKLSSFSDFFTLQISSTKICFDVSTLADYMSRFQLPHKPETLVRFWAGRLLPVLLSHNMIWNCLKVLKTYS